jgi:Fe-S-cluster containining protein
MEAINDGLIPWRLVKRWECIRCGWCCRNLDVHVTVYDEERLKKYGDVFWYGKIGVYLKKVNGACIFYDGLCKIYPERPRACIFYPFYFLKRGEEIAKFGKYYVYVDRNCRGIGRGRRIEEVLKELVRIKQNSSNQTPFPKLV